jgi:hypothetical protein
MLVIFLLAALGSSIPQVDVNKICQSAQFDSLPEHRARALRGCVGDETWRGISFAVTDILWLRRAIAQRRLGCNSAM